MLMLLRPSGPGLDALADLIARLVAQRTAQQAELVPVPVATAAPSISTSVAGNVAVYWLTPVKDDEQETATECVKKLVQQNGIYAFGERTPGRRHIKAGDGICFYATGYGVIAHAKVSSPAENKPDSRVRHPQDYPYVIRVQDQKLYEQRPIVIDAGVRQQLDAFSGRDPERSWAWFVQATRKITEHDFRLLTRA
jgi:hypothetical protein